MPLQEYKIVVLGAGGVGKSAICVQFVNETFLERYDPTIEDMFRKVMTLDSGSYVLEILDTAGTDQFSAMRDLYYKSGHGFVLVYSILATTSLEVISQFHKQILRVQEKEVGEVPMVLVGNKVDLEEEREVPKADGEALAGEFSVPFMETSAKTKTNVEKIFTTLINEIGGTLPPPKRRSCSLF